MKHPLTTVALAATLLLSPTATAADTTNSAGCSLSNGNWYCGQTNAVTYTGFGQASTYKAVTSMDAASGACKFTDQPFGGGMAPLDGEVSWHFRGPLRLKQFAFYTLGGDGPVKQQQTQTQTKTKRHSRRGHGGGGHRLHHRHWMLHEKRPDPGPPTIEGEAAPEIEERAVGGWVTVTMDGKVVSWQNAYGGSPATAAPAAPSAQAPPQAGNNAAAAPAPQDSNKPAAQGQKQNSPNTKPASPQQTNLPATSPSSAPPSTPPAAGGGSSSGSWTRKAYYNAASKTATGVTFLAHLGGASCSGTWDTSFGNSLSYVSSSGKTCSSTPQPLSDTLLPDNTELSLFTSTPCSPTSPCTGYSRPGSVAHHGFAGASKLFLLEFSMPLSNVRNSGQPNDDMPALWLLNAAVSRTQQYGACSCWASGCGELDIVEVLTPGETRAKSTWHGRNALGDSAWFARPTGGSQKVAVILDGQAGSARIVYLDEGVEFGDGVDGKQVQQWMDKVGGKGVVAKLPAI